MTGVVVLGDVMLDVVTRLAGPVALGSDSPAAVSMSGGGQAANTAAWLAAAGCQVALVGRVGGDAAGRQAADTLGAQGVDPRLAVDPERPTGTCVILVAADGERTMFPDAGANEALAGEDLPDDLLRSARWLHVSGYALLRPGSRPAARAAITQAREAGLGVSVDPSSAALLSQGFLELAEGAGLLLPNAAEAAVLSGSDDPERAARGLARQFPEVVVTLGERGALWSDGRDVLSSPAVPVGDAADSTGAGDAFAAGYVAARLAGAEPAERLASGCRLAARAVSMDGARPPALSGQH